VTAADLAAHQVILAGLQAHYTGYSSLVREGVVSFAGSVSGAHVHGFVDPLDGPPKIFLLSENA